MKRIFLAVAASTLALAGCGEPVAQDQATETAVTNDDAVLPGGEPLANADPGSTMDGVAASGDGPVLPDVNVTPPRDAQDYITQAASADQYEIQASQLVLEQSKNPSVRAFAQQMIDDHRAATQKLQAAARGGDLPAPSTQLSDKHQKQIVELRAGGSSNIDQFYISQQRGAHAEAIALHQGVANARNVPDPLAAHARDTLIIVQSHARMLRSLNPAS